MASLEARLRVTEERLHSERADRAEKLSEVESKLIAENAQLQVRNVRRWANFVLWLQAKLFLVRLQSIDGDIYDCFLAGSGCQRF